MTLTLTHFPHVGRIIVAFPPISGDRPTGVTITRSSAAGTVQLDAPDSIYPWTSSARFTDHTPPIAPGPVEYFATVNGQQYTGRIEIPDTATRPLLDTIVQDFPAGGLRVDVPLTLEVDAITAMSDTADDTLIALERIGTTTGVPYIYRPTVKPRTGTLTLWAAERHHARFLRDHLTAHPFQYLRLPDHIDPGTALAVTSLAIEADGPAWTVTGTYTEIPGTVRLSRTITARTGRTIVSVRTGYDTLADLAHSHDTLAEVRQ